jgi:hypothetical protein
VIIGPYDCGDVAFGTRKARGLVIAEVMLLIFTNNPAKVCIVSRTAGPAAVVCWDLAHGGVRAAAS